MTPTKKEIKIAIGRPPSGKSLGKYAIPAIVTKCGNTTLLVGDLILLSLYWEK